MAHNVEPMDIDNIESDFDNKENSIHHSNVYPRTPCTEKGYEELDVSELNMKLRYSITPAASPMSRSYTANCPDNYNIETSDDTFNSNLTRSLNSAFSKGDTLNKSVKTLPLQTIPTEHLVDGNRNASVLRQLDSTFVADNKINVTITQPNDIDENLSFPSSSSSTAQTPEATTPTIEIQRGDGGSPIMRGLKSVLNMFRSSQSPIPPADSTEIVSKQVLSPTDISTSTPETSQAALSVLASTPIAAHKNKEGSVSKRSSPHKESIVFNDDLEKELLWKDETTILFSQEKIPIHKLFFQPTTNTKDTENNEKHDEINLNNTVEYMDVSYNDSVIKNKTITELQIESDGEFVDCETTFTNDNSAIGTQLENKEINKEDEQNSSQVLLSTDDLTNVELTVNDEISKTELPQADATVTLNNEKENNIDMEPVLVSNQPNDNQQVVKLEDVVITNEDTNEHLDVTVPSVNDLFNVTNVVNTNVELEPSVLSNIDKPLLNMSFDACNIPDNKMIITSDNVNITRALPESDVNKSNLTILQDHVRNSTFVQQNELISDVCNATYNSKCDDVTFVKNNVADHADVTNTSDVKVENSTFVKEVGRESLPSDDINTTTTIAPKLEDATFTKEIACVLESPLHTTLPTEIENVTFVKNFENITLPSDVNHPTIATNDENMTFIKETEIVPVENTKICNVGYNTFVEDIKSESKVEEKGNTSTPSTELEVPDSPANIPLPDEDDLENDKSMGTSILVEERKILDKIDIFNTSVTNLEDENNVEKMPMIIAKSIDVNSTINYPAKELVNDVKLELTKSDPNGNKSPDHNILPEDGQMPIDPCKTTEELVSQDAMNINESIIPEHPIEPHVIQSGLSQVTEEHNLDISMAEDFNMQVTQDKLGENTGSSEVDMVKTEVLGTIVSDNCQSDANIAASNIIEPQEIVKSQDLSPFNTTGNTSDTNDEVGGSVKNIGTDENKDVLNETAIITEAAEILPTVLNMTDIVTAENTDSVTIDVIPVQVNDEQISQSKDNTNTLPECTIMKKEIEMPAMIEEPAVEEIYVIDTDVNPAPIDSEKEETIADNLDENVVLSGNNSPFVSVAGQIDSEQTTNLEEIQNPFATKSRVVLTPPSSPKIVSKGYNFNFEEIDDPFATKTKIRLSPTPEKSPNHIVNTTFEEKTEAPQRDINKNRRKSQPERKRPVMPKKKLNSTFSGPVKATKQSDSKKELVSDVESKSNNFETSLATENKIDNIEISKQNNVLNTTVDINSVENKFVNPELEVSNVAIEQISSDDHDTDKTNETIIKENLAVEACEESKSSVESLNAVSGEVKTTSSSEQSAYYSAGTSSSEGIATKNVFNIPEIDDMNFNPFVTKMKMRQSPPLGLMEDVKKDDEEIKKVECGVESKPDTVEDTDGPNVSNTTCSSKATDERDVTVREVPTEDEDTEEGPFLETDNDKMSDFDGEDVDMMQFTELPPQNKEGNDNDEMFIDAEAFEFLLNQNKSNVVSDSGKESLFLKFDPLFAKRVSTDGVLAALHKVQKRQSTPKKTTPQIKRDSTFDIPGPSNLNVTQTVEPNNVSEESEEDANITVSKPMMVVTPAVNPIVTPRNKPTTPTSSNRRSITFTSPAIAVIDRLLSLSANNSLLGHDTTVTVSREQNEADLALTQLRELLAEKEISVYNLRSESKELKDRLTSLESQMRTLETESEARLRKVNELNEKLTEKTKINKSMAAVVEECERAIASLIAETEQDKKRHNEERIKLIQERDEQTAHLASMEVSFSDLHSKYEKSKQIILTCKANEDSYKKSIKEFEENLSKMQSNYELLKQHATSKLNHANQELEKMNRAHESEVLKMNAMIKRKELHITSLEETLAQKTKANEELTAICDELINKVG